MELQRQGQWGMWLVLVELCFLLVRMLGMLLLDCQLRKEKNLFNLYLPHQPPFQLPFFSPEQKQKILEDESVNCGSVLMMKLLN